MVRGKEEGEKRGHKEEERETKKEEEEEEGGRMCKSNFRVEKEKRGRERHCVCVCLCVYCEKKGSQRASWKVERMARRKRGGGGRRNSAGDNRDAVLTPPLNLDLMRVSVVCVIGRVHRRSRASK